MPDVPERESHPSHRTPAGTRGQTNQGIWTAPAAPGTPLTTPPGREDAPDPAPETEHRNPAAHEPSDGALMVSEEEDPRADERQQRRFLEAWTDARQRPGDGR